MASGAYGIGLSHMAQGDFLWKAAGGSTIRAALVNSTYTPNFDTDEFVSVIGTNRVDSAAADVADEALTLADPTVDTGNNEVELDATNPITYSAIDTSQTARAIAVFRFITNDAASLLLTYNQFASDLSTNGSDVEVTFAAEGLLKFTY